MSAFGRYGALLANRGVVLLVSAQIFARIGEQFVVIGLLWEALDLTHSSAAAGIVLGAYTGGTILAGFFAASLLDRYPRKPLMLADNAIRVVCMGALAWAGIAHTLNVWVLVTLACIAAMASAITIVGTRVYLPTMVPQELVVTAFAVDSSLYQVAGIAGPALAGLVTGRFGASYSLAVAALCFLLFVGIAAFIPTGAIDAGIPPQARELSISEELGGARYIVNQPVLRAVTLLVVVCNFFFTLGIVALAFLSKDAFGAGPLGQGIMLAALAVGALVSSIAIGSGRWPYPRGASLIASSVLLGILLAVLGLAPSLPVACVILFVTGLVDAAFFVWMSELRQRIPPPELLARTISASMILNVISFPFASAAAGFAVSAINARRTFEVAGVLMALYSLLFVRNKALRTAP